MHGCSHSVLLRVILILPPIWRNKVGEVNTGRDAGVSVKRHLFVRMRRWRDPERSDKPMKIGSIYTQRGCGLTVVPSGCF